VVIMVAIIHFIPLSMVIREITYAMVGKIVCLLAGERGQVRFLPE